MEDPEDLAFQARLLAAGLGIEGVPPSETIPADVIAQASDGHAIEAIRLLRKARKLSLLQAKRIVDAIQADAR
jgi:ribosomal protein L7/L12